MKKSKKPLVVAISLLLVIVASISFTVYTRVKSNDLKTNKESLLEKVEDQSINTDNIEESNSNELLEEEKKEEVAKEELKKNNTETNTSKKTETKNNTESNSNTSTSNNSTSTNVVKEEPKQEEVKEEPKQSNESSNNVPAENPKDPNPKDFYYSIHGGVTNTKSQGSCEEAAEEIALIDTVDILNVICYEVHAKDNSLLGYFLDVNCSSGNCNRYKSQIDWNKYKNR